VNYILTVEYVSGDGNNRQYAHMTVIENGINYK
jgi:hypothetical protein